MVTSNTSKGRRTQAQFPIKPNEEEEQVDDYSNTHCEECGSGDNDSKILLCDKCNRGFHLYCLKPILVSVPVDSWFCSSCSKPKKVEKFPLVQSKIIDFFKIDKSLGNTQKPSKEIRRRRKSLVLSKKKRKLLAYKPTENLERRLFQMASLATALTATNTKFSNELEYLPGLAPRSANKACFEKGGMQVLSKDGIETLNLCKSMMERGECPPLVVVSDPLEGFTVEADEPIKDLTIIAEFSGEVDYWSNRLYDDSDSMMTLISSSDPSESLVICPHAHGNVARYINGINNHTREGKKKQNVKCIRFDVGGECRVLLISSRDIRVGERLYYDYNAYEDKYPTHHFI